MKFAMESAIKSPMKSVRPPKVSVVIPAYNAMAYLPAAVETVLNQTFSDFEVLIVDDGSVDPIAAWVAALTDPRIQLIRQTNQGLSAARNTGIRQAQGDYVAFLDADDLWAPTKLAQQVQCLDADPNVGLVHTAMLLVDVQGRSTGRVMTAELAGSVWSRLVIWNGIACPSVMVRRDCFDRVGQFDQTLRSLEDWDMWLRLAAEYEFAVIPAPLAYYRQVPHSMSKNCQVMEASFHTLIEKAFRSASPQQQHLKPQSYATANLCLAWKAIQSQPPDLTQAVDYWRRVVAYYPPRRWSPEYLRLSLAIGALRWMGVNGYQRLLDRLYAIRRRVASPVR
jgi:glycosyltransferase involved in cell wall biosynthesis